MRKMHQTFPAPQADRQAIFQSRSNKQVNMLQKCLEMSLFLQLDLGQWSIYMLQNKRMETKPACLLLPVPCSALQAKNRAGEQRRVTHGSGQSRHGTA